MPQGSILGPLLFILFIIEISLHTKGEVDMYADDSTLLSVKELEDQLNPDLEQIDN